MAIDDPETFQVHHENDDHETLVPTQLVRGYLDDDRVYFATSSTSGSRIYSLTIMVSMDRESSEKLLEKRDVYSATNVEIINMQQSQQNDDCIIVLDSTLELTYLVNKH